MILAQYCRCHSFLLSIYQTAAALVREFFHTRARPTLPPLPPPGTIDHSSHHPTSHTLIIAVSGQPQQACQLTWMILPPIMARQQSRRCVESVMLKYWSALIHGSGSLVPIIFRQTPGHTSYLVWPFPTSLDQHPTAQIYLNGKVSPV